MKIKTAEELLEKIARDLSTRKKELTYHKIRVKESNGLDTRNAIRAGITILYAHWEGAIKNYTTYYLCLVSNLGKSYQELHRCFSIIKMKKTLDKIPPNSKYASIFEEPFSEIGKLCNGQASVDKDLYKNAINTESNLKYKVFEETLFLIGLDDINKFALEKNFIDEVLVGSRNIIAHGDIEAPLNFSTSKEEYCNIHDRVINLIDSYAELILDCAIDKKYLKYT